MILLNDKDSATQKRRLRILALKKQISDTSSELGKLLAEDEKLEQDAKKAARILDATEAARQVQKRLDEMVGHAFRFPWRKSYMFFVRKAKFIELTETSATVELSCNNILYEDSGARIFESTDKFCFNGTDNLPPALMETEAVSTAEFTSCWKALTKIISRLEKLKGD